MKAKNLLYLFCLLYTFVSCGKEDILTFKGKESGVYFQYGWQTRFHINSETYKDSLEFSFSKVAESLMDTAIVTRIRIMGNATDYPRPVKLSVDVDRTTAVEGIHYTIDWSKAVIPANESDLKFPVTFHRTPDMIKEKVVLVLKLEANEHFNIYFTKQNNTNVYYATEEKIEADRFKFVVGEIYTAPSCWYSSYSPASSYFGEWTMTKFCYINRLLEIPIEDWERQGYEGSKVQVGRWPVQAYVVRNALQEAADAGEPVMDEDGKPMQLGSDFEVDYSAYENN